MILDVLFDESVAVVATHRAADIDGRTWKSVAFRNSDHALKEGLAQYYAVRTCERLIVSAPEAGQAYEELLKHQPESYTKHVSWLKKHKPEEVRFALVVARREGETKLERFEAELKKARRQLRQEEAEVGGGERGTRRDQGMKERALQLLRQAVGDFKVQFRPGQWEAIQALVVRRERLLVVERTGWGKSVVYFIATKLLREQGAGCTLLISPLLALMRNQIAAAERIGVRVGTINSSNPEDWPAVEAALRAGQIDILLVSPERLANEQFMTRCLLPIAGRVGLFVVDEAHCISDWGHDFRLDYRRIARILKALPRNLPVLATTATANDRVVEDVSSQLGPHLKIIRGPLVRESLRLGNLRLPSQAARMARLADRIPKFKGSGIIYTLTVRDAENVAA